MTIPCNNFVKSDAQFCLFCYANQQRKTYDIYNALRWITPTIIQDLKPVSPTDALGRVHTNIRGPSGPDRDSGNHVTPLA